MEANKNIPIKYFCNLCDYGCCKKSSWDQHILTTKHSKAKNGLMPANKKYACENCSTTFKHQSSYCRHKKKCIQDKNIVPNNSNILDNNDLIIMLVKQNAELMEIVKNGTVNNSHNTTHTNSHNKMFNLQFFLNETCKDAMNITDFVDSIKLQLSDLIEVGELGFVDGISKIIVKNLNNLDETIRPIHCTDKKRETIYIKDEGEWKKDDNKTKLKRTINIITDKNIKLLPVFREKYPDYKDSRSRTSDIYDNMVIQVMETDDNKKEKIIHNISKVTIIKEK